MVTNESSLFTYLDGESWELFNYPDFIPYFLDELINRFEEKDQDFLNMTRTACENNIDCVYDTLATRAMEIGLYTKTKSTVFEESAAQLVNYPPRVNGTDVLRVEVNKPTTIQLTAEDPNGDLVKFRFLEEIDGAEIGEETGTITWKPVNTTQLVFQVQASDGKAVAAYKPVVQICDCKNNGTCLFDTSVGESDEVNSKFKVVACSCSEAYSGSFCETDYDGCLDDPCFPGVKCTDVEAPGFGAICEECPYGLYGDGKKCYDIDECFEERDLNDTRQFCQQECINTVGSYNCGCYSGYVSYNRTHCEDIDECYQQLFECPNNAHCVNTMGSYICTCDDGYKQYVRNNTCINVNECIEISSPCPEYSTCEDTEGGHKCMCLTGFEKNSTGYCEDINECTLSLSDDDRHNCNIQASCHNIPGSFQCTCTEGWHGDGETCQDINECDDVYLTDCDPQKAKCSNTLGSYTCTCIDGYEGNGTIGSCTDIDECLLSTDDCPRDISNCDDTEGSYKCICKNGYEDVIGESRNCTDIDECERNTHSCEDNSICSNLIGSFKCICVDDENECLLSSQNDCNPSNNICENADGSYVCLCKLGYTGDGNNCTDINECTVDNGGCEHTCVNTEGNYYCTCNDGYEIDVGGFNCKDIDECILETHTCPQNCTNTETTNDNTVGYVCSCVDGFMDQGTTGRDCIPEESCANNSCVNGICYVLDGVQQCQCEQGYELDAADQNTCLQIDECDRGTDMCYHNCHDETPGYRCSCREGYTLDVDDRSCSDIDECIGRMHNCTALEECINTDGGFKCVCIPGYGSDSGICEDVDECQSNTSMCHVNATCTNTIGQYECDCNDGFSGNGVICADINECIDDPCPAHSECSNTVGNYTCTCDTGFELDGNDCNDINECNDVSCDAMADCVNTIGSYYCECIAGYEEDEHNTCNDVNECLLGRDSCDVNSECQNTPGSYICDCNDGYSIADPLSCQDINECLNKPCGDNERCVNNPGSYQCQCKPGYYKEDDKCKKSKAFNVSMILTSVGGINLVDFNNDLTSTRSELYTIITTTIEDDMATLFSNSEISSDYLSTIVAVYEDTDDSKTFKADVKIVEDYKDEYDDLSSSGYKEVTRRFTEAMRIAHTDTTKTRSDYQGCHVQKLSRGSVNIEYILYFKKDTDISVSDLEDVLANYNEVIDVTSSTKVVFKDSTLLIQEYTPKACDSDVTHDCSVDADCIDVVDRFHCDCNSGYEDESPERPGRICTEICPTTYCVNGGTCVGDSIAERKCECPTGYVGHICEKSTMLPSNDLDRVLVISIGTTATIITIALVISVIFCCLVRKKQDAKSGSVSDFFNRVKEQGQRNMWRYGDDDTLSDISWDSQPEEQLKHLAKVMEHAPRFEKPTRPNLGPTEYDNKGFVLPYVAKGTEAQDSDRAKALRDRSQSVYDAAYSDDHGRQFSYLTGHQTRHSHDDIDLQIPQTHNADFRRQSRYDY
ncbi:uncharacterized protein LOC100372549 [Saccoglossus kowalevskii]